jgi:hypothetical protein
MNKMKVKIISDTRSYIVEEYVNQFIHYHNVVDIQFKMSGENNVRTTYSVMIIYEE